jgi:hypothetical protein
LAQELEVLQYVFLSANINSPMYIHIYSTL